MPGRVRRDRLVPVAGLLRLSVRALGDVPGIEPGRFRGGGGLAAARPPRRLGTGRRLSPRGRDQFPFSMSVRAAVRTLLETGLVWSGGAALRRAALVRRSLVLAYHNVVPAGRQVRGGARLGGGAGAALARRSGVGARRPRGGAARGDAPLRHHAGVPHVEPSELGLPRAGRPPRRIGAAARLAAPEIPQRDSVAELPVRSREPDGRGGGGGGGIYRRARARRRLVRPRPRELLRRAASQRALGPVAQRVRPAHVWPVPESPVTPPPRLKVLHVVHKLDLGGLERMVGAIVRLLDPDRFESHLLPLSEFGRLSEGLDQHARLHRINSVRQLSMIWPVGLIRAIRAIAPHVVHTHSGVWYKASLAARRAGVPRLVHTDHGRHYPDPWKARLLDGLAARRTDVVAAVSDALRRQMTDTLIPRPAGIRVVGNGVDTDRYRPRPANGVLRAELGLEPRAPVIGSIGRLDAIKAYDVMIEAVATLRAAWREEPKAVLRLVGDGAER